MTRPPSDEEALRTRVVHLNELAFALGVGVVAGAAIAGLTAFLLVKGGPVVGPHLALLGQVLPGYEVSRSGAVIGFGWGLVAGGGLAFLGAWLYNRVAVWRRPT
jgi:hypothetical protein